jgi:hypothetical protein
MPQLEIQTFISQYLWFFFGNFIILYVLVYLKVIPNLHIRNFLLSELSQADLSFLSTDLNSFKSFPIMFNSSSSSFPVQPSARSSAGGLFFTPSYTVPVISKEIRFKILEINLNSHNFVV